MGEGEAASVYEVDIDLIFSELTSYPLAYTVVVSKYASIVSQQENAGKWLQIQDLYLDKNNLTGDAEISCNFVLFVTLF